MARKKSTAAIEAEITKVKSDMTKLQDRYDNLAEKLKDLQAQKRKREADAIMVDQFKGNYYFTGDRVGKEFSPGKALM